jgi:hypothetical protein
LSPIYSVFPKFLIRFAPVAHVSVHPSA